MFVAGPPSSRAFSLPREGLSSTSMRWVTALPSSLPPQTFLEMHCSRIQEGNLLVREKGNRSEPHEFAGTLVGRYGETWRSAAALCTAEN